MYCGTPFILIWKHSGFSWAGGKMDADQLVSEWDECDDYQCDVMSKDIIGNLNEYLNKCQGNVSYCNHAQFCRRLLLQLLLVLLL